MRKKLSLTMMVPVLVGLVALTGCPPKKKLAIEEKPLDQPVDAAAEGDPSSQAGDITDIQIGQEWAEIPALQAILFGYDAASLDDAARNALKQNVAIIKKLPKSVTVRVEGHCDDRGTIEYNIALGQRRANAVRSYYVSAGVGRNRIETISFGEERPVCTAASDECYAQNRRGVTKVRNAQAITIKAGELE